MTDASKSVTFRQQVGLLLLDKLGLALALALGGFVLNLSLQRDEKRIEYQKELFETRREAYVTILGAAERARDEVLALFSSPTSPARAFAWRRRFERMEYRLFKLAGSNGPAGAWGDYRAAVESLQHLERLCAANSLYLSRSADARINEFLDVLARVVEEELALATNDSQMSPQAEEQSAIRVAQAYEALLHTIREALRIDDMVL